MRTLESRFLRTIFAGIAIMIFIGLTSHSQALASTESVLHSFTGSPGDGYGPHDLLKHVNGFLYGTSTSGGSHNQGTVFELRPVGAGWSESIVWDFGSGIDGTQPQSRLVTDSLGNLYGTTVSGGRYNLGTVFEL